MIPNVTHPDCACVLATQERDLISEADDADACLEAVMEIMGTLYPPIVLPGFAVISRPSMN